MRRGYTLVEILISVSLSLFLLLGVTHMFRTVGTSLTDTQATLNMTGNLRQVALTLRGDLNNLTEDVNKPSKLNSITPPGDNGYFQIIEGRNVPNALVNNPTAVISTTHVPMSTVSWSGRQDPSGQNIPDTTVGDVDDILMFTARAPVSAPFRGLVNNNVAESTTAEIIYFVRGNTLYRRVLLILENNMTLPDDGPAGFYGHSDVSVRREPSGGTVVPNTLSDLSRREYRFGHWTSGALNVNHPFPFPIHFNAGGVDTRAWYYLRMPTLEECANDEWIAGQPLWAPLLPSIGKPELISQNLRDLLTVKNSYYNNYDGFDYRSDPLSPPPLSVLQVPYWDFWENANGWYLQKPDTGSIHDENDVLGLLPSMDKFSLAHGIRAGEDILLTNVISFDVKVWNPYWVPLSETTSSGTIAWVPPQYVDLGQDQFHDLSGVAQAPGGLPYTGLDVPRYVRYIHNFTAAELGNGGGIGFCSKGRYSGDTASASIASNIWDCRLAQNVSGTPISSVTSGSWSNVTPSNLVPLPCVYDTWTAAYEMNPEDFRAPTTYTGGSFPGPPGRTGVGFSDAATTLKNNFDNWECPPPYTKPLKGIEITIRCFDPRSRNIKQIRIVKDF